MRPALITKVVPIVFSEAIVDNAAFTTTEIDSKGFDHCQVIVRVGTTDIAMTVLKMQHSDTSGSGFTDIDGCDFDGDTDIDGGTAALPSATDDDSFFVIDIDLVGKKRYLDLSATAGDGTAGTWLWALAILSKSQDGISTIANRGATSALAG